MGRAYADARGRRPDQRRDAARGLIDEASLLVAPVADGRIGTPALFDVDCDVTPYGLALDTVERCADDVIWLRYRVEAR